MLNPQISQSKYKWLGIACILSTRMYFFLGTYFPLEQQNSQSKVMTAIQLLILHLVMAGAV